MPKINLKTLAYNTIRNKIVTCQYAPGTFLNEEQLTTELSLSRTPVRDALGRLEQEGLLEIRPKCGILVRPLTLNDIDMTFEVRMLYEPYILSACPNEFINRSYDTIQTQNERFRYMTGNVSNFRLEATFKEHTAIVEPCLEGDWEKAAERLIYHLEQSKAAAFRLVAASETNNLAHRMTL